jgi:hypothetical protein
MDDHQILQHIDALVAEERDLRTRHAEPGGLGDDDQARLKGIEDHLDQAWDLLRQRRAAEQYDRDPGQAAPRPINEVESYQQ